MPEAGELLGDFLRSRRERLKPDQVGLPATRRRRTPGLKREEVAAMAGISVEWYVKLEQGRAITPSPATIDALAGALRLSPTERAHLVHLARPGQPARFEREMVPAVLHRFVRDLAHPAYVTGLRWDLLTWNAAARGLFDDFLEGDEPPNLLLYMLTDPRARAMFADEWSEEARRMIALFRSTHDLWAGDAAFAELVARMSGECPEFDIWWKQHDIENARSGLKTLHHPVHGARRFAYCTFQSNDDSRLKISVLLPE